MRVEMRTLPLEHRADIARELIVQGEDPYMMLAAALWPQHVPTFVDKPTLNLDGYCSNGHPWNEENTYYRRRPGVSHRKCRACERESRLRRGRKEPSRLRRKVPCAYCGKPATSAADKGRGGKDTPRCRACFMHQLKTRTLPK